MKEGCGLFLPVQAMLRAFDEGQNAGWSPLVEVDTSSVQMLTPYMRSTAEEFLSVCSVSLDTLTTTTTSSTSSSSNSTTIGTAVTATKSVVIASTTAAATAVIHRTPAMALKGGHKNTSGRHSTASDGLTTIGTKSTGSAMSMSVPGTAHSPPTPVSRSSSMSSTPDSVTNHHHTEKSDNDHQHYSIVGPSDVNHIPLLTTSPLRRTAARGGSNKPNPQPSSALFQEYWPMLKRDYGWKNVWWNQNANKSVYVVPAVRDVHATKLIEV